MERDINRKIGILKILGKKKMVYYFGARTETEMF